MTPLETIEETFEECKKLLIAKNKDYAGEDFFKNLKACETFGVNAQLGIIVRMTDKLSRLSNLVETEPHVTDEKFEDTARDMINYCALLIALRKNYGNKA